MASRKFKVFLSYAAADDKWADAFAKSIHKAGLSVWYDKDKLLLGDNWGLVIGRALEEADAMVVVLSPESVKSPWVRSDINYALGEERFRNRLIPVEVKPAPDAPWILREHNFVKTTTIPETADRVTKVLLESSKTRNRHESMTQGK